MAKSNSNPRKSSLRSIPKKQPVFDPQKPYSWQREQEFPITGSELELLNNTFQAVVSDPATQRALAAVEGLKALTGVIKRNVEAGLIVEAPQPEQK